MQAKHFRWVFLPSLVVLFFSGFFKSGRISIGASGSWSVGNYQFSGGTEPWALLVSAGLLALYLLLLYSPATTPNGAMPGIVRRFVAFWCDFTICILGVAPFLGILPCLLEWKRTGEFQWTFERETAAGYDAWVVIITMLAMLALMAIFFAWPLVRCKPTPGSSIMGYQIVGDDGNPITWRKAVLRSLLGFVAACAWFVAPFVERDKPKGKFWLDRVFKTHSEKLL
jgi:uncharacterized RDD family membrane protein YckC